MDRPDQSDDDHQFALPRGTMLFEYRIEGVIGHGGFGITYRALDTLLNEIVAIKEFFPNEVAVRVSDMTAKAKSNSDKEALREGLDAFLEEARIIARFRHPNIMQVRRFFEAHGTGYIVLQFERGPSLEEVLARGPLREADLRFMLTGILNGLDVVHKQAVLHRDLKPRNVIIRDDGSPVLIDFGAARDFRMRSSRSVTRIASPGYSPPEQYGVGGQQGPWSDFYALGAILYRAATGTVPADSLRRLRDDPLVPAETAAAGRYPASLLRTIDRMMRVDERQRPISAAAIIDEIAAAQPDTPAVRAATRPEQASAAYGRAGPPEPPLAAAEPSRSRSPALWAVVGVLVLLLAAGGAFLALKGGIFAPSPSAAPPGQQARTESPPAPAVEAPALEAPAVRTQPPASKEPPPPPQPALLQPAPAPPAPTEPAPVPAPTQPAPSSAQPAAAPPAPPVPAPTQPAPVPAPTQPAPSSTQPAAAAPAPPVPAPAQPTTGEGTLHVVQDCPTCPDLAVLPAGRFDMGTTRGFGYEKPVHPVTIGKPPAIGRHEVTFAQWDACVVAGGCKFQPGDHGWGRGDRPVIGVSWLDAQAYVQWLSRTTAHHYRLPSEAEWEYADRAGTASLFWWGPDVGTDRANCSDCQKKPAGQTLPVGSYRPNAFGLFDTAGNAAEWVEDCWNPSYDGAPSDGSARMTGDCSQHVLRGGSFNNDSKYLYSGVRFKYDTAVRYYANGFRVARDMN